MLSDEQIATLRGYGWERLVAAVERIATDAAWAAERALVEQQRTEFADWLWRRVFLQLPNTPSPLSDEVQRKVLDLRSALAAVQPELQANSHVEQNLQQAAGSEPTCMHCGHPIRQLGPTWEHYSPTWQGRRCPGTLLGADLLVAHAHPAAERLR